MSAYAAGSVVVLTEPRTFPALTDEGIRLVTMRAGLAVQVSSVSHTGFGLEIKRGAFMTWINRNRVRPASKSESEDFMLEIGEQRRERMPRQSRHDGHAAPQPHVSTSDTCDSHSVPQIVREIGDQLDLFACV